MYYLSEKKTNHVLAEIWGDRRRISCTNDHIHKYVTDGADLAADMAAQLE